MAVAGDTSRVVEGVRLGWSNLWVDALSAVLSNAPLAPFPMGGWRTESLCVLTMKGNGDMSLESFLPLGESTTGRVSSLPASRSFEAVSFSIWLQRKFLAAGHEV